MPRFNVKTKINGEEKWTCWSSIVDDFVTEFQDKDTYEKWRQEQYGKDCGPVEEANQMELADCLRELSLNRDDKSIVDSLIEVGLMEERDSETQETNGSNNEKEIIKTFIEKISNKDNIGIEWEDIFDTYKEMFGEKYTGGN